MIIRERGILVRHRRYGYRAVIVEFDLFCKASDEWYRNNQTQPSRDQHWYHLFVHGSEAVTYAAESSLDLDESGEAIKHPLIPLYFSSFSGGKYTRNTQPWI